MKFFVSEKERGLQLHHLLRRRFSLSLRTVRRQLEANSCRLNGAVERFGSRRVQPGDRIDYRPMEVSRGEPELLFENERLLALNKPAGVTTAELGEFPVHRLDRDTTGVLLLAKDADSCRQLQEHFRERSVQKRYLAIVEGVPPARGVVRNRLGVVGKFDGQRIWGECRGGREAITRWERLRDFGDRSLVACLPETGRTHQIRVHMAGLGHPIVGDGQYGREVLIPAARTLLHAEELIIESLQLRAPLPGDFEEVL